MLPEKCWKESTHWQSTIDPVLNLEGEGELWFGFGVGICLIDDYLISSAAAAFRLSTFEVEMEWNEGERDFNIGIHFSNDEWKKRGSCNASSFRISSLFWTNFQRGCVIPALTIKHKFHATSWYGLHFRSFPKFHYVLLLITDGVASACSYVT